MVILIDSSGSMKGLRMEIAKATVERIVDTLSDDDFFNVVKVTSAVPTAVSPAHVVQWSNHLDAIASFSVAYQNLTGRVW